MRKKMKYGVLFSLLLLLSGTMAVHAENDVVTYTAEGKISGGLSVAEAENTVSGMQPGDTASFELSLKNENENAANWYMKNQILKGMEDTGTASGGAYSYRLVYEGPDGKSRTIYDSELVGGDDTDGLRDLGTALQDYFYLGRTAPGEGGRILLYIGLDGESQGNSYQTKLVSLSMSFAVEPETPVPGRPGTNRVVRRTVENNEVVYVYDDGEPVPLANIDEITVTTTDLVKTGDETAFFPYVLAACISGSLLMLYGILFLGRKREKEEEKGAGA